MAPFESRSKRHQKKSFSWEWLWMFLIIVILSIGIRIFLYAPFHVMGPSMQPTLHEENLVFINKWKYYFSTPTRGDIVVFQTSGGGEYIKRIVGLPGETLEIKDQKLFINGKVTSEPYLPKEVQMEDFPPTVVPDDHFFVLGDDRTNSHDSRSKDLGPVPEDQLIGKVVMIYWPITDWKLVK